MRKFSKENCWRWLGGVDDEPCIAKCFKCPGVCAIRSKARRLQVIWAIFSVLVKYNNYDIEWVLKVQGLNWTIGLSCLEKLMWNWYTHFDFITVQIVPESELISGLLFWKQWGRKILTTVKTSHFESAKTPFGRKVFCLVGFYWVFFLIFLMVSSL